MHIAVGTGNPDEVMVANSSFWRSMDGGLTFNGSAEPAPAPLPIPVGGSSSTIQ